MEINQNKNNIIEIKHVENDNEIEITNSKDEFLNNNELNNKVDLNNNNINYKLLKEDLKFVKNDNNLPSRLNKEKNKKIKINNLNKIGSNPFLTGNSLPNYCQHKQKFNILPTSIYCTKIKNENLNVEKQGLGKSIFSKISESLLQNDKNNEKFPNKNIINLEQINEDNYNQLTEELYLHSKTNKNNENKKIISEFLERKKKEEIIKKIGMENDSNIISEMFKDLKRSTTLTDRNRSYKPSRTFGQFLEDQKRKEEQHKNLLKKNEFIQNEKININIRDKPLLNEETIKIINKSVRDKTDIHLKLYKEYNEKKKREEEKIKGKLNIYKNKEKKMTQKKIDENSNRLFNEYRIKKNRNEEINKNVNKIKKMNFNTSISKNSNDIFFKKIIIKLKHSFFIILGKNFDDNMDINYFDFLKILYDIGFFSKNYFELINSKNNTNISNYNNIKNNFLSNMDNHLKNKEKETSISELIKLKNDNIKPTIFENQLEFRISNDAWKIITKNQEFKNNVSGNSKNLIFFIMSVVGGYEEGIAINKSIKKEIEQFKIDLNSDKLILATQIYKYFHIFRKNAINRLLFRDKKRKIIEIINENDNSDKNKNKKKSNFTNIKNEINKKRYISVPYLTQDADNSKKYLNSSIKQINEENYIKNNEINKSFNSNNNLRKMLLNNLTDNDVKSKHDGFKDMPNKIKIEKIINEKGLRINNLGNKFNNIYEFNVQRLVNSYESLNNYKDKANKNENSIKTKVLNGQK